MIQTEQDSKRILFPQKLSLESAEYNRIAKKLRLLQKQFDNFFGAISDLSQWTISFATAK